MPNQIKLNSLYAPAQLKHFIQEYHKKANELYGLQIPKIGKSKNIFSKAMGLNSWSSYESLVGPDSLGKITLGEVISVRTLLSSADRFRDAIAPSVRITDLGWLFDSFSAPRLEKVISGVTYRATLDIDLSVNRLVFTWDIDGKGAVCCVFGGDSLLVSVRDELYKMANREEDGNAEFLNKVADSFAYAYCQFPILLYVYGCYAFQSPTYSSGISKYLNESNLETKQDILDDIVSELGDDDNFIEYDNNNSFCFLSRMTVHTRVDSASLSTPLGMYRVITAYQESIEKELSLPHLSNQKIGNILESISDFSYQGVLHYPLCDSDISEDIRDELSPDIAEVFVEFNIQGKEYFISLSAQNLCYSVGYFRMYLVGIDGCGTGGPPVLRELFSAPGADLNADVYSNFISGFFLDLVDRKHIDYTLFTEGEHKLYLRQLSHAFSGLLGKPRGENNPISIPPDQSDITGMFDK